MGHDESHKISRSSALRAAVMGANDGIVSTASILTGVVAGGGSHDSVLLAGIAGVVAGAMSMATGEYVSVSSQADTERAALAEEQRELDQNFTGEMHELAAIYVHRGLNPDLARQVAMALMKHDALNAHARDELGITEFSTARPLTAALFSAGSFMAGALLPLSSVILLTEPVGIMRIVMTAMLSLVLLGALSAKAGGAPVFRSVIRVSFWSSLAMAASGLTGSLFSHFT
ncbi:VIT family protein [Enterobacter sp. BRE11]|nr:VIT family protein [Enterobacter sp. BRE11]